MPLLFPSAPSIGQQYSYNGRTWQWTGSVWQSVGTIQGLQGTQGGFGGAGTQGVQGLLGSQGLQGLQGASFQGTQGLQGPNAAIAFSTNPPSSPLLGDRWTDSNSGSEYTWVTDGVNYYWVELSASGYSGVQGVQGVQGLQGIAPNLLAVGTDMLPAADNTSTLGNNTYRWKSLSLGPGTLSITDQTLLTPANLTVVNGVFNINGAQQVQVGNIRITGNGIQSLQSAQDITIGNAGDTGYLATARGIKFPDGTIQTSAVVPINTSYASTWAGTGLAYTGTPLSSSYISIADSKMVTFRINATLTTVTNFGSGAYTVTLPSNSLDGANVVGDILVGTTRYRLYGLTTPGSSTVTLYVTSGNNTHTMSAFAQGTPATLTTSSTFNVYGTYIAA